MTRVPVPARAPRRPADIDPLARPGGITQESRILLTQINPEALEVLDDAKKIKELTASASMAAELLKALANPDRLMILCLLAGGERNVGQLQESLGVRQPTLSQQLSKLRADDLVQTRREGKSLYSSLSSQAAGRMIELLYELYCASDGVGRREALARRNKDVAA